MGKWVLYGLAIYGGLRMAENLFFPGLSGGLLGDGRGTSPRSWPSHFYVQARDPRLARSIERPKTLPRPGTISIRSRGFRMV